MLKNCLLAASCLAFTSLADAQSLTGENARDFARVTAPTLAQINGLRATITADAVRRLRPDIRLDPNNPADQVMIWHTAALNVTAVDHTPRTDANDKQLNFKQFGPHRTSRALAIVHLAIFEVANAYSRAPARYASWIAQSGGTAPAAPPPGATETAAIIGAAYTTLAALYDDVGPELQKQRDAALAELSSSPAERAQGMSYGEAVANQVLALRKNDGSDLPEPRWFVDFTPRLPPNPDGSYPKGQWQVDPVSNIMTALGGNWPQVKPFVMTSGSQFRGTLSEPPAPDLKHADYRQGFVAVFKEGADAARNLPRDDTPNRDHYFRAKFWSYDATAGLCAPVRLYNQISDQVLDDYRAQLAPDLGGQNHVAAAAEVGRYYALINTALADAGIAAWDGKYHFQYWRPVTAIRYEQERTTAGEADVDPVFEHRELWYPLGAQNTNSVAGYNITPPFPAYPSGHAVFGAAMFEVLQALIPKDHGFSFDSDEFNGRHSLGPNIDVYNFQRCRDGDNSATYCNMVRFNSFKEAEQDNAESRVWMGVHWQWDADRGNALGEQVGQWVMGHAFTPAS